MTIQTVGPHSRYQFLASSAAAPAVAAAPLPQPVYAPSAYYPAQQPVYATPPYVQPPVYATPPYVQQPMQPQPLPNFLRPAANAPYQPGQQPVYAPQPAAAPQSVMDEIARIQQEAMARLRPGVASYPPALPYPAPMPPAQNGFAGQVQALQQQIQALKAQVSGLLQGFAPNGVAAAPLPSFAPPPPPPPPPPLPAPIPPRVAVAPPAPVAPAAPSINLPGLRTGQRFQLANGTSIKGHSISGTAQVTAFDGKRLDLTVQASAAMGFVQMTLAVRCEVKPDGTMRIDAHELGANGQPKKSLLGDSFQIVKSSANEIILKDAQGRQGALRMDGRGTVTLEHPEAGQIILQAA